MERADLQYQIIKIFQELLLYWYVLAFSSPFLVLAWYCLGQAIEGAPEPAWWLEFEALIGVTW